jgi:quercetin dioxygenase-like cupin family protein
MPLQNKTFASPDEDRKFADKGHMEVLQFEDTAVGRGVFEPGWRWSQHVKPIVGTESCQAAHTLYVVQGRMRIVMDDGTQHDIEAGDVVRIPPGHDAFVLGNETCVLLDFSGAERYARDMKHAEQAEPQPAP